MNFILTKACNKGCPYCFARENRLENPAEIMTFSFFKKILEKFPNISVKLLGGEPTLHPQFIDIVNYLVDIKKDFILISNFLFSEEILQVLLDASKKINIGFLVNATDLDENNRIEIWKRNYNTLYKFLYERNEEYKINLGLTLTQEKSLTDYISYLNFLDNNIIGVESLRLSIAFPGPKNFQKDTKKYINDKDMGEKFKYIICWCFYHKFRPNLDCNIYPCLFSNKEDLKFINNFLQDCTFKCDSNDPALDLFPDGSIQYCYPVGNRIKRNIKDYNNISNLRKDLEKNYNYLFSKVILPEECKNCMFYKNNICAGPSLCQYCIEE